MKRTTSSFGIAVLLGIGVPALGSAQVPEQAREYRQASGLAAWAALQPNYRAFQTYYAESAVYHDCLARNLISGIVSRPCSPPRYPSDAEALASGCSSEGIAVPGVQPIAPAQLPAPGPCGASSAAGYGSAGPTTNLGAAAAAVQQNPQLLETEEGTMAAGAVLGAAALLDLFGEEDAPTSSSEAPLEDVDDLMRRADSFAESRQWSQAERLYLSAVQAEPRNARALAHAGWAIGNQGRHLEAEPHLREALALDDNYIWAREILIWNLERLGRSADASKERETLKNDNIRIWLISGAVGVGIFALLMSLGSEMEP